MRPAPTTDSLQRRVRDLVRAEAATTAIDLFLANGFDETTVDEICDAAGMSRRTFFRYFKGKEDVVLSVFTELAARGCDLFVERPSDEPVWTALRYSMQPFIEWVEADQPRAAALLTLVDETPTLRASYLDRVDAWRASLASVISARTGARRRADLPIAVIAAASMGAFVAATRAWRTSGSRVSLAKVFDQAFRTLQPDEALLRGA